MSVGINANLIYASIRDRNQLQADAWAGNARKDSALSKSAPNQSSTTTRALEYQQRTQDKLDQSVVNQTVSYAQTLRASRAKAKESSLEKKKLQYSFKKISSQIVRSKTSQSARKAASAARREVQRLKRLQNTGEYDEEELQISIEHAKAMEIIAKKKVAHLQQEEMIERGQNGAMASLEEIEEEMQKEEEEDPEYDPSEDEEMLEKLDPSVYYPEEFAQDLQSDMQYAMEEAQAQMQYAMEEAQAQMQDAAQEGMDSMMSLMRETLQDMAEELDLTELANTLAAPDPNMSEEDLKMLKMKHRTKEMQDIAKADKEYLKAIMDKYEKKGVAGAGFTGGANTAPAFGASAPSGTPAPVTVTVPASYGSEAAGVSFNAFA